MTGKRATPPTTERFYSVSVVARWLGVTEVSIKNWSNAGKLIAVRTAGGHRRITASSVVAMLGAQGRAVPRELSESRPVLLLVARPRDELVKRLRRTLGDGARVEVIDDDYLAAMAAVRLRPAVVVLDLASRSLDAERWIAAARAEPTLGATTILLVGDGTLTLSTGTTRVFPRRDADGLAEAAIALVRQLAIA